MCGGDRRPQAVQVAKGTSQRWRQAVVWLHVLTSVGWMAFALVLFALLTVSYGSDDQTVRISATSMAHVVDMHLLAPFANAAAFTGIMLGASTAWGILRNWWVVAKFAITVVQLYAGIFILSDALEAAGEAARAGLPTPPLPQLVGTALMASAIAFQAWLSVAKPWRRTPWAKPAKPPTAPTGVFVAAVAAPVVDIAMGIALGFPSPLCQLLVLTTRLISRRRTTPRVTEPSPA
ncbi:hypothetical protein GCM10011581_05760 [Saccharopolyspora subtropica]|uniref:DUF2269 domain-containing protein n=1 Tax=Saccharopolyspora thermophila TaxID=89367 RepID=A0A917JIV9_9PSEU|nr:hypothetical protein [Saccharopolyspora subtropica]GGI71597.1 hypothetical protein GCM10011581_05760 [Saccharopolyspora subtropica]